MHFDQPFVEGPRLEAEFRIESLAELEIPGRHHGAHRFHGVLQIARFNRHATYSRLRTGHTRRYSALTLPARTTLAHFSLSSTKRVLNSAGLPVSAVPPS